ncbi:nidogen-2 [Chanos chanos]|uniref:Nidogen-2 n=1 Tax=Chanos chanos TaxID=29144 RepID=A0A6J2WF29_CHACN|nr:nidogen-2 [Chanos chanos]
MLTILFLNLSWAVWFVTAIQRSDIFPYGALSGDLILQEGDDETSQVITLTKPMYFYEALFRKLYVATNGIISTQDLPMEKQYVDDGFPTDFPVIAPFLADIDTSNGRGAIYYRLTESPNVLNRVASEVQRGFPDARFTPTHAVIATWENVAAYEETSRSSGLSNRVNTFQAVVAYDETDTYALFLYPEDGLQFFGTRPKESYNVEIELPARVGFSRGEVPFLIFSRTEGPYYSITRTEQSVKNLYQMGNTGIPGVWLFHIGNRYSFDNVIPAAVGGLLATVAPRGLVGDFSTTPEYPELYPEGDEVFNEDEFLTGDPDFQTQTIPKFLVPERDSGHKVQPGQSQPQPYDGDQPLASNPNPQDTALGRSGPREYPLQENHNFPPEDVGHPQRPLPEQAVLEVYPNREEGSPPHAPDGEVVSIDEETDFDSGVIQYSTDNKETCARFQQQCSQNGYCTDYTTGFCCHCRSGFYGNGRHCLPNGVPHRVNGKVSGVVSVGSTPVELNNIDLHAYIVVGDGRAYTAMSQVPEPVGWALMPVAPIGGLFGWLFALELPNSQNGFRIAGAEFTRYADVTFYPGNQRLSIVQTAKGLDSENYLSVDTHIHGSVPFMPPGATVQLEPFKETYQYYPTVITSTSVREFTVVSAESGAETFTFQLRQNITYRDCRHGPRTGLETQQLSVERVFVMYIKEESLLRYAITNKISPVGAENPDPERMNPCYSGTHDCDTTAQCLPGEGLQFQCQCATGYRGDGHNCYDVDECAEGLSLCGAHSECVNLPGNHRCQCQSGYEFGFDGRTCVDIDECRRQPCHTQASCSNTLGSFQCQCQAGFQGDGFQCEPQTMQPERPKTPCEQHRDSLQGGSGVRPLIGAFIPQCDEEGQYRPLQCHGSTGHCWCVDSRGQERVGTRTPPGTPPTNCDEPDYLVHTIAMTDAVISLFTVVPPRPKTQCEQHRDSLQGGSGGQPLIGAFIPQCDEEGQYRPLQCHGSTGHCWCVDSRGQEREGTRTPPGTPPTNCDEPVPPPQRPDTVCERWRASLIEHYGGEPGPQNYLPQCDSSGEFNPLQCYGDSSYCWCVDKDGREVPGTRSHDVVKPACTPTVAPPTIRPIPRPDVTPPPFDTSLLYAQGQQIGALPLKGTRMDKEESSVLLALHGSIVVGIDYDCRERKVYWTDLAGRTINRASMEAGSEPEILINTGLTSPEGLAVDVARRRLFWVDSTPDKIETANLDGSNRRVLFDTDLVNPRAIIVDSPSGTLFWTDWNRDAPKIESSTVDGLNRRVLVRDGIGLPNALTYDSTARKVCWADAGTKHLECIAPDGTGRRVIRSNLNYPFSMVFYANHYYYTDWRRDGVIAISRDASELTDEYLPDQRSHLYGITVASPQCL